MTPRQLDALLGRRLEDQQMQDLRFGRIACLIYDAVRTEDSPELGPADFFPSLKLIEDDIEPSEAEQLALMTELVQRLGGKDLRKRGE